MSKQKTLEVDVKLPKRLVVLSTLVVKGDMESLETHLCLIGEAEELKDEIDDYVADLRKDGYVVDKMLATDVPRRYMLNSRRGRA